MAITPIEITTECVPPSLFGQNLEHTRACLLGGLSAQLIRNRKFAGKPSRRGVAADWLPFGGTAFYEWLNAPYTRHFSAGIMPRRNELGSQCIQNLDPEASAGIRQDGLALCAGKGYTFRAALRSFNADPCRIAVRIADGEKILAEHRFVISSPEWKVVEFRFDSPRDIDAELRIAVEGVGLAAVGMVSLLPEDHFHGMRPDVVAHLKSIGTSILRWPGGNFAGEYRWRDGLLDPDLRAPLQSFTEIETQPYNHGYDDNELGTNQVVALCREIGAEPFFTINPVWDSPEESAAWVEYCNGAPGTPGGKLRTEQGFPEPFGVRFWSLGNEMGYRHMEGPGTPEAYAELSRRHALAMREVSPEITLFSSGIYPSEDWVNKAAVPLADVAPLVSLHKYTTLGIRNYTTPERADETIRAIIAGADQIRETACKMRRTLPENLSISFDEWNVWYSWYREVGVAEGLFAARVLHQFLASYRELGIGCVCYFQPVNEGAIAVSPRSSRLTAMGQVMRLFSRHAGGTVCDWPGRPEQVFATKHGDGTLLITAYNDSVESEKTIELPVSGILTESELDTPSGRLPGSNFVVSRPEPKKTAEGYRAALPPLTVLSLRFRLNG